MKEKKLTPELRRFYSLVDSVRTMLRRNYTIMFCNLGFRMTDERRLQISPASGWQKNRTYPAVRQGRTP